jgi:hypothetical protein
VIRCEKINEANAYDRSCCESSGFKESGSPRLATRKIALPAGTALTTFTIDAASAAGADAAKLAMKIPATRAAADAFNARAARRAEAT